MVVHLLDTPTDFNHTSLVLMLHSDGGRASYGWWSCFLAVDRSIKRCGEATDSVDEVTHERGVVAVHGPSMIY